MDVSEDDTTNSSDDADLGSGSDPLFYSFLTLQTLISLVGFIGNALLCYGVAKRRTWPYYQRLLFLNVTAASLITAAIHSVQGLVQLIKCYLTGNGELTGEWSDIGGDSAHLAVAFGMMALAFQNLYALRQYDIAVKRAVSAKEDESRSTLLKGLLMIALVWACAVGCIVGGLNPHAEAGDDGSRTLAGISYAVHLSTQASVAVAIYLTHRTVQRLETDFAARGAQQNLHTRTRIKETISLTSTITWLLILQTTTWVASFTCAFLIDHFARIGLEEENSGEESTQPEDEVTNRLAAYTGIVDCLALIFEALYPLIMWRMQPQIRKSMRSACCWKKPNAVQDIENASSTAAVRGKSRFVNPSRIHEEAIGDLWEKIAKANRMKLANEKTPARLTMVKNM